MYEVYETDDRVLSMLELPTPCGIRIELHENKVILHVGPRDWEWSRETGECSNAGTVVEGDRNG